MKVNTISYTGKQVVFVLLLPVFFLASFFCYFVYIVIIYCSNARNAKKNIKFILLNHGKLWILEIMTTCSNDTKVTCYVVDITSLLIFYNQWETSIYYSMKHLRFGSHSYVAYRIKSVDC